MNREQLTEVFKKLGADEPDVWAMSEVDGGIPQLARFLFLKGAWEGVEQDNEDWIARVLANYSNESCEPYSGMEHAIKKMVDCGVPKAAITELCRCVAAEMIFHLGYMIDDPSSVTGNHYVNWGLFQLDDVGKPVKRIPGLHESVLETDPTGREMEPRFTS